MTARDEAARQTIREETGRNMFVVAGAGSGKTKALIDRIATLVLRDGVSLSRIVAVTFTDKAAAELRDRLRAMFEQARRAGNGSAKAAGLALIDLDMAAIGTLHSFAARILLLHPIEAGMPPKLTPADEISSGIAGEEEWGRVLVRLLEDEKIRPTLQRVLLSVSLDKLESLYQALAKDWDLIETRVLAQPERDLRVPDLTLVFRAAGALQDACRACTGSDELHRNMMKALDWVAKLHTDDDLQRYETLLTAHKLWLVTKPCGEYKRVGATRNWTCLQGGIDEAKTAYANLREQAVSAATQASTIVLERLTRWLAREVLAEAEVRRQNGELTFHDLLVVARQVLRDKPEVAQALNQRYTHLLLDEFQDTDPIQIELAVRIAGGAAGAVHPDWMDIDVPSGSLFVVGDPKQSIYRFRRANIGLYLDVQDWFRRKFGDQAIVELDTNFRSAPGVLDWVNHTFSELITYVPDQQPDYLALHSFRTPLPEPTASVTYLGWDQHDMPHYKNARVLREREAEGVAGVVAKAVDEGWLVADRGVTGEPITRPIRRSDIAVLVPARTSLPMLKTAFDTLGIPHRAEASSLLYASEDVAELLLAAQAVADRSDGFALVMTLRSSLFGLGDDDLWRWKHAGGTFSLSGFRHAEQRPELQVLAVFPAMAYLRRLSLDAPRLTPAELLERIIRDRSVLEVAADTPESVDRWRRLRFIVDQARAWSQTAHGGLRAYLAWAKRQASETAQVYESILPETDVDAVRILTIHAAKGLEFPMVILSGMTALPRGRRQGIKLLWTRDGYAVSVNPDLQTTNFDTVAPIDEQMGSEERKRLLYVATTRARDHLVVSLHRAQNNDAATPAELLRSVVPDHAGVARFDPDQTCVPAITPKPLETSSMESRDALVARLAAARALSIQPPSQSASGLEGSEPEVVLAVEGADDEPHPGAKLPLAKAQRDLDTPSYNKGRDATAIGTAVHGVLQTINLATGAGLDALADMQCLAYGIPQHVEHVKNLVRRALDSPTVRTAAANEYWRESLLAMTTTDGEIVEGYADLIYRDAEGNVHVIDYKTDTITTDAGLAERTAFYAPQLTAYVTILREATGREVDAQPLFLDNQR